MILSVFASIFKITLITLLYILAAIIVIFAAILLIPFRYDVAFSKDAIISYTVTVAWLFGIIKIIYNNNEVITVCIKLFGFSIYQKPNNGTKKSNITHGGNTNQFKSADHTEKSTDIKSEEDLSVRHESVKSFVGRDTSNNNLKGEEKPKHKKEKKQQDKSDNKNLFKQLWAYKSKKEVINACIKLIKQVYKALSNIKIKGQFVIGTNDPYATALVIGAIYSICGIAKLNIAAEGDFEKFVFTGAAEAKGSVRICAIVYALLCFIFNKHIWRIIKRFLWNKP